MHILQGHAVKSWAIAVKLKVPIMHESFKPLTPINNCQNLGIWQNIYTRPFYLSIILEK